MKAQAERFGTRFVPAEVTRVDLSTRPFQLWSEGESYTADAVIIATGASAKWLGIPSEKAYQGKGVSACATCDGFFFREWTSPWWAAATPRIEEANFLTKYANKVYLVHRRAELRASKVMQERARKNPKIEFVWNTGVDEVLGDGKAMTGLAAQEHEGREHPGAQGPGLLPGHRPRAQHRDLQGAARHERGRLPEREGALHPHQP